jgi:hypothetical protein
VVRQLSDIPDREIAAGRVGRRECGGRNGDADRQT